MVRLLPALLLLACTSPSEPLPPPFPVATTCSVPRLGPVLLGYPADCSCVAGLYELAREVLAEQDVVSLAEPLPVATTWVHPAGMVLQGVSVGGGYSPPYAEHPELLQLDASMDTLAHELVHAWRFRRGSTWEQEIVHEGWDEPRGQRPSLRAATRAFWAVKPPGVLCAL